MCKYFKILFFVVVIGLQLTVVVVNSEAKSWKEADYQRLWCNKEGGKVEYRLKDKTRVDCLTDEYAIEFDYGKKWAEAIGQALYYATQTGHKPGVVLIVGKRGKKYTKRLEIVNKVYGLGIKVWFMDKREYH